MLSAFQILLVLLAILAAILMSDFREAMSHEDLKDKAKRVRRSGFDALARLGDDPRTAQAWVLPETAPNAFVVMGRDIFLTEGLVQLYERGILTRDEISAIIAHELAHIDLGHYRTLKRRSDIAAAGGVLATRLGGIAGRVVGGGLKLERLALSRAAEFEADARAVEILRAEGISPRALSGALQKIAGGGNGIKPVWLETHPPTAERIARIDALV